MNAAGVAATVVGGGVVAMMRMMMMAGREMGAKRRSREAMETGRRMWATWGRRKGRGGQERVTGCYGVL